MDGRLILSDGRTLAWHEYGDPAGRPLIRLQGTPGSRLSAVPDPQLWDRLGLRVIMIDRPGFGASTRLPGRGVAVVADDLAELLDHLHIDAAMVLGLSGGGPHALAFGARHPHRIAALSVVVGFAPLIEREIPLLVGANAEAYARVSDGWEALHEFTVRQSEQMQADPVAGLRASMRNAPAYDLRIMSNPVWQTAYAAGVREALRPGPEGWTDEVCAVLSPWDFSPADVNVHVEWWAGRLDANCPLSATERFVEQLPSARLNVWEDVGHFAQYVRASEFLRDVLRRAGGLPVAG